MKIIKKKAPEELVVNIVKKIFENRKVVRSQEELVKLVRTELSKENPQYSIGTKRLRKIITLMDSIKIEVKSGNSKIQRNRCPVCGGKLKELYTANLKGEKIVVGYVCVKCGYRMKTRNEVPKRYHFYSIQ